MIVLITGATSGFGMSCAELFSKKGYKTILIGRRKERLLKLSNKLGVKKNLPIQLDVRDKVKVYKEIDNFQRALYYKDDEFTTIESIKLSGPGQNSYQLMDDAVLEASVNFLKNHAASKSDEPFCLTASFMLPHPPYVASQEDYDQVKDKVSSPRIPIPARDEHPWIKKWRLLVYLRRYLCSIYRYGNRLQNFLKKNKL